MAKNNNSRALLFPPVRAQWRLGTATWAPLRRARRRRSFASRRVARVRHLLEMFARRLASSPASRRALGARARSTTPGATRATAPLPEVGQVFSAERAFTADDVAEFARLSQDTNPIHIDSTGAVRAGFPAPVVHGMLCASLFGAIIGTRFPGAVYATQSLAFRAPVLVGESVVAEVRLTKIGGSRAHFATRVRRGEDVVLDGTALALLPRR